MEPWLRAGQSEGSLHAQCQLSACAGDQFGVPREAETPQGCAGARGAPLTCVGQEAVAGVASNVINARALVQAGVGSTFVDIGLAVGACVRKIDRRGCDGGVLVAGG